MNIRRAILALALTAGIVPAFAQAPAPVPALPDTERRTTYSISGTTCACSVGFALYGDSTDYQNWVEVFVNGVMQSGNWTITSPSGPLGNLARPITDAVLTFATAQTGTVQIVGARRPRRTSQFNEGVGVPTRNFNVVLSDLTAQNRETWDKINDVSGRTVMAPPGETLALLPKLASRANMGACFDSGGNLAPCVGVPSGSFAAGTGIAFTGVNPTTVSTALSPAYTARCNPTGSTANLQDCNKESFNVRDFSAVGDGSTDDTTAIQNTVTAAVAIGAKVYFPPGNYKISAQINVNGALTIRGVNSSSAIVTLSNLTANGFVITTGKAVKISNLTIQSASQQAAGAMIQLTASGGENQFSVFRDLVLLNAFVGTDIVAAANYTIDNCYMNATSIGLHIRNTFNADHGDPNVTNNTFLQSGSLGGSVGVEWESGGGVKFIGNKINGYQVGFLVNQAPTASTSIMLLESNSIENQSLEAIAFQVASGSPTLSHVVINGNHIAGTPLGISLSNVSATWPTNVAITNNVILLNGTGQQGISVLGGTNVMVGGNAIRGGGGSPTGILTGSSVASGQIGLNAYNNLATTVSNLSGGVAAQQKVFSGLVASNGTAIALPLGWSVSRSAAGVYLVTHNLNNSAYGLSATSNDTSASKALVQRSVPAANNFSVITVDGTSTGTDAPFSFVVTVPQ